MKAIFRNERVLGVQKWKSVLYFILTFLMFNELNKKVVYAKNGEIFLFDEFTVQSYIIIGMSIVILMLILIILRLYNTSEKKIKEAYMELHHITNSVHAGFVNFILEGAFEITYASDGYYDIVGFDRKSMKDGLGNSFISLVHPDDYATFKNQCENFAIGEYIQFEVRLYKKDQSVIWVLINGNFIKDKESRNTLSAVIIDITESRNMQERILLEEERYRVAAEISNDILFEYEVHKDKMILAEKFKELYGKDPVISNFISDDKNVIDIIHSEDIGCFYEFSRALTSGKEVIEAEFRMKDISGEFVWCHIRGKTLYNESKKPCRVIGKIVNIDLHKKELQTLEYKAKRDSLTGVYNKSTTKELIDHYIHKHKNTSHVFMIIDIDDFKHINDTYGHLQGDKILSYVINQVKAIFTSGEIIGRIGGDEFVVFIGNIQNKESVLSKAELLKETLHTVYTEEGYEIHLTGSIGVSIYPEDGHNYNELLNCADKAMYLVKDQGKNGFKLFT